VERGPSVSTRGGLKFVQETRPFTATKGNVFWYSPAVPAGAADYFASALLSSSGVTIEEIAHLVGHGSTSVTERVYRKELRPVITRGARAINELFDGDAKR
jgi:hypothetical protein